MFSIFSCSFSFITDEKIPEPKRIEKFDIFVLQGANPMAPPYFLWCAFFKANELLKFN